MSPPIRCARMTRAASRETRNEPRAITSCWMSQSARVVSSSGLEMDRPALLTTRSTPPKASAAASNAPATASCSVTSTVTATATSPGLAGHRARRSAVAVGHDHAGALGGEPLCGGPADARPAPGDQRDAPGQRLGLGPPAQLGLLEFPVLDAELLAFRDRLVGGHRLGPAHHVDRVQVELARHAGRLGVLAVAEHPEI